MNNGPEHDQPETPTSDSLIRLLIERVLSTIELTTSTARLAAAETRLAATSAGMILALGLLTVAMTLMIWLLLVALAGFGLYWTGMSPVMVLLVLLTLHVLAAAGLVTAILRLSRHLNFPYTRQALAFRQALQNDTDPTDGTGRDVT